MDGSTSGRDHWDWKLLLSLVMVLALLLSEGNASRTVLQVKDNFRTSVAALKLEKRAVRFMLTERQDSHEKMKTTYQFQDANYPDQNETSSDEIEILQAQSEEERILSDDGYGPDPNIPTDRPPSTACANNTLIC